MDNNNIKPSLQCVIRELWKKKEKEEKEKESKAD